MNEKISLMATQQGDKSGIRSKNKKPSHGKKNMHAKNKDKIKLADDSYLPK